MYQRKVMFTLTRAESGLVADVLMKAATDPLVRQALGWSPQEVMKARRAKNSWKKIDRRITKRDEAQKAKENGGPMDLRGGARINRSGPVVDSPDDLDVPLEGI